MKAIDGDIKPCFMSFIAHLQRDLTKNIRITAVAKYTLALVGTGHW